MHVSNERHAGEHNTAPAVPPPAPTSQDAAIGGLSSQNGITTNHGYSRVHPDPCALNVPCGRDHSTRDWFAGIAIAFAIFFALAAILAWLR